MKVLCVAAHPDDEVLGPGGTLARHANDGDDVAVCFLSDGVASRHQDTDSLPQEQITRRRTHSRDATDVLGVSTVFSHTFPDNQFDTVALLDIVQTIEAAIDTHEPSVVYTHHHGDLNVDHELTARATLTATRPLTDSPVRRVLGYETLSSTEWAVPAPDTPFQPVSFVDVSDTIDAKLDALAAYEDELRTHPHPRTVENVRANARLWGAKSGFEYAEAFDVLRERDPLDATRDE